MIDLRAREMALTAELVRQRIEIQPELHLLSAAGVPLDVGYTASTVWIQLGDKTLNPIEWQQWWDPGLSSREDQAAVIAHRLLHG